MKASFAMLGLLALLVGGCGVMGKADTPVTMRLAPAFAPGGTVDRRSVAVAAVNGVGEAAKARYTYIDPARPGEINQARSLFWEEPPPHAVEHALVAALRTRFATVTGPDVALPADIRVLTVLNRFEEVSGEPGKAVVAFEATVIEHGKVTMAGKWCAVAQFAGTGPSERASAFAAALVSATTAFAQDIAAGTTG